MEQFCNAGVAALHIYIYIAIYIIFSVVGSYMKNWTDVTLSPNSLAKTMGALHRICISVRNIPFSIIKKKNPIPNCPGSAKGLAQFLRFNVIQQGNLIIYDANHKMHAQTDIFF